MTEPNDKRHYLSAIRIRLECLYELTGHPAVREQISDEIDWLDEQIATVTRPDGGGQSE